MSEINSINDFMSKIKLLYPLNFKDPSAFCAWQEACVDCLYNPKVDYAKLYEYTVKFNPNGNFAPDIAWLLKQSKLCFKAEAKRKKSNWRHVKVFNPIYKTVVNTDCFPIGTTDEQILKTYEKKFPNVTGWKIIGEKNE